MSRVKYYNRILQGYDSELIAIARYGRIDVFRKGYKYIPYEVDGETLLSPIRNDWYIFSLTHDWTSTGVPVEWGSLPLLQHLKDGDLWRRNVIEDHLKAKEADASSKDRDLDNKLEAFWKDNRRAWAKNFEHLNTRSVKLKDRRYEDDKKRKLKGI